MQMGTALLKTDGAPYYSGLFARAGSAGAIGGTGATAGARIAVPASTGRS